MRRFYSLHGPIVSLGIFSSAFVYADMNPCTYDVDVDYGTLQKVYDLKLEVEKDENDIELIKQKILESLPQAVYLPDNYYYPRTNTVFSVHVNLWNMPVSHDGGGYPYRTESWASIRIESYHPEPNRYYPAVKEEYNVRARSSGIEEFGGLFRYSPRTLFRNLVTDIPDLKHLCNSID